jgi:cell shape-determining protein MreC
VLTQPILSFAQPVIGVPAGIELLPGSAVLVEGTVVGLIQELRGSIAIVDLLWQKNTLPLLAQTSEAVQGLVTGDGRRVLFTEVPIDAKLEVGQRVFTTGQRGVATGLFVGVVRSITTGSSAAVKTAVLEQYVSFYQTNLVEVQL